MSLTVELPDSLIEQCRERGLPDEELKAVVIAALEVWLAEEQSTDGRRFSESAVPFVRRLIAQNRELFEVLSQR